MMQAENSCGAGAADPAGDLCGAADPDGNLHDETRYPAGDRAQVLFDQRRHSSALRALPAFREQVLAQEAARTPAQRRFLSDSTLVRYLRARDGDLAAAAGMLEATLEWRAKHFDTDCASERCCQPCATDARSHCFFPLFTDTAHRPVVYSCAARAANKVIEDNMMHMAWEIEHLFGGSNADPGKFIWLVDMNGFG
jgi:hypothetical protein